MNLSSSALHVFRHDVGQLPTIVGLSRTIILVGQFARRELTVALLFLLCASGTAWSQDRFFQIHPFLQFGVEGYLSSHVELADIDNDGDLDFVVANGRHWPQANIVYLNNGAGRAVESFRLGQHNRASYVVRAGDVNADGHLDLVVVGDQLPIEVHLNDGNSGFEREYKIPDSKTTARAAILLDLNSDRHLDLVVAARRGASRVFQGTGRGTFQSMAELPISQFGATGLAAGDLDNDSDTDLVVAMRDDQQSVVLINHGQFEFEAKPLIGSRGDHRQVLVGRFSDDDHNDVVLGRVSGGLALYISDRKGGFDSPVEVLGNDVRVRSLAQGDLNGDGKVDIIVGGDEQANIALINQGKQRFDRVVLTDENTDTYGVSVGDVNGDRQLDIVFANSSDANTVLINRMKQ